MFKRIAISVLVCITIVMISGPFAVTLLPQNLAGLYYREMKYSKVANNATSDLTDLNEQIEAIFNYVVEHRYYGEHYMPVYLSPFNDTI